MWPIISGYWRYQDIGIGAGSALIETLPNPLILSFLTRQLRECFLLKKPSLVIIFCVNHHHTAQRTMTGAAKVGAQNGKRTDAGRFKPKIGAHS